MTNTYASFKGKLKVGDRVRHNHQSWNAEAEVLEVDEEWFRTTEGCFLWTWDTGTLELLSPPPRVVTLETLEIGDQFGSPDHTFNWTVIDIGVKTGTILAMPSDEAELSGTQTRAVDLWTLRELRECGYVPVQPASPPAPAEKEEEWWEDRQKFWKKDRHLGGPECPTPLFEKIIAEAKRRGAEEVRNAAKAGFMECDTCRAIPGTPPLCRGCLHNRKIIESLNKPAGAGEK